ncbi:hypothetical protein CCP3SC15_530019 [Gammaproteobacteria bacterium]
MVSNLKSIPGSSGLVSGLLMHKNNLNIQFFKSLIKLIRVKPGRSND